MRVMEGESETTLDGKDSSSLDIVEVSTWVVNELIDLEDSAYNDISSSADSVAEEKQLSELIDDCLIAADGLVGEIKKDLVLNETISELSDCNSQLENENEDSNDDTLTEQTSGSIVTSVKQTTAEKVDKDEDMDDLTLEFSMVSLKNSTLAEDHSHSFHGIVFDEVKMFK